MFVAGAPLNSTACGTVAIIDDEAIDGEHDFQMMLVEDILRFIDVPPLITNITILDDESECITSVMIVIMKLL